MTMRSRGTIILAALLLVVMAGIHSGAAQPRAGNEPGVGGAQQQVVAGAVVEPADVPAIPKDIDLNPRIFMGEPDGSNMKPLLNLPEYDVQGMPSWSSDGSRIALEAWRSAREEINDDSKIVV